MLLNEAMKRGTTITDSKAISTPSYAAQSAGAMLAPHTIHRRQPGLRDVLIDIDFCGERGVIADVELIDMDQISSAYKRMQKSAVKYRFVIDLATLRANTAA